MQEIFFLYISKMKALTKEQIEYIELKLIFQRMQETFEKMKRLGELECYDSSPLDGYPLTNGCVEHFFYLSLEKSKQEKIKRLLK